MASPPSLVAVAAGDPIMDTDISDLQAAANRLIPLNATPNQTTSSTSWSDVAGLTFAVVSGKQYAIRVWGQYSLTAVGNGFVVGYNTPGGTVQSMATMYGNGGATTALVERVSNGNDGGTGIATCDSTASRSWQMDVVYNCTSSGTFAIRWRRPGSTNSNVTMVQAGGLAVVSA